jgi:hypothetical protein
MNSRLKLAHLIVPVALSVLSAASLKAQSQPPAGGRDITFAIKTPLKFKGRIVSGSLRKSEIEKLLDLPVRNGDYDPSEGYGVEMTTPAPEYRDFMVYTCREWKKALADGAYAATTVAMTMESFLIDTCGLLFELQKARLPAKSFIANPKVSLANLDLLPAEMLTDDGDSPKYDAAQLERLTVSKVVPRKDIEEAKEDSLTLTYGNFRQSFWEGARADFNGDGIEDILVFTGGQAVGGTLGFSEYFFLTRTRPSGPLTIFRPKQP